jgi:hypothetical protein
MIEIRRKLCASALALALGGFTSAGCIDNSGNKTYPRGDAGTDVAATDTPVTGDAPTADTPAGDVPAPADTGPGDTASDRGGDTASDRGGDTAVGSDAPGSDIRVDLAGAG